MKSHHLKGMILSGILVISIVSMAKPPVIVKKKEFSPPPKVIRTCCSFGTDLKMMGLPFLKMSSLTSLDQIGTHEYMGDKMEGNGIIYTHSGGFIDLGHLRDWADYTAFLFLSIKSEQEANSSELVMDLGTEGGQKILTIQLKKNLTDREIAQLAGKVAYDLSMWHEIATWFNVSYVPFVPEAYSAFSPEDLYSNLTGINLGISAILSDQEFNESMTGLLADQLKDLGAVETEQATYFAMEMVRDEWWTREKSLPSGKILMQRYISDEDILLPWLVEKNATEKIAVQIPKTDSFEEKVNYQLDIKLNYKFSPKLVEFLGENRVINQGDFSTILSYIIENDGMISRRDAIRAKEYPSPRKKRTEF